ncbi:TIGR04282 family arsenosugar biosynthesis glycosyltransferase [Polyangium jinanense]|uniref:DUF2064 domain-containing protein n=1 Tax=Polyangium jinanense TaxID=2829994 RepID=A0A9X3X447_9BACT|nr:DUF2064 domain-containing protein [Polyangium jinanense]MDC3954186.1 DUF2064 domain-containing protein [Polyangium jinanense]MDC3981858.1 DUF2064 domain-containing protein [Polyangium jinanense]
MVRRGVADHRARPTVRPQRLALGVLARAPIAGTAKPRLSPPLSPEAAAELSSALLGDALNMLAILPMAYRAVLSVSDEESAVLQKLVPGRWQHVVSAGTMQLEKRLGHGLEHLFTTGAEAAAIVTTDAPFMPIDEVFEGLLWLAAKRKRALLGPTGAGGLYLIGTTHHEPALFDGVDWTSPGVLERATKRAAELGLETLLLKPTYEIDTPADLDRFARDLASGTGGPGMAVPACAAFLARAGLRPVNR